MAQAIFDTDMLANRNGGQYLARSAALLRSMVGKCLRSSKGCEIGKDIRLILTEKGPVYVPNATLSSMAVRRVGDYYYTQEFGTKLFRDAILH